MSHVGGSAKWGRMLIRSRDGKQTIKGVRAPVRERAASALQNISHDKSYRPRFITDHIACMQWSVWACHGLVRHGKNQDQEASPALVVAARIQHAATLQLPVAHIFGCIQRLQMAPLWSILWSVMDKQIILCWMCIHLCLFIAANMLGKFAPNWQLL